LRPLQKTIVVLLFGILFSQFCYAEETDFLARHEVAVGYSFLTKHFRGGGDLNENNNGIVLYLDNFVASTFENSNYNRSWFIGYAFRTKKWKPQDWDFFCRLNFYIGPLYGYGNDMPNIGGWTVGAVPTVELGYKHISLETMVAPFDGGVVSFIIKYTF
jgi:hypothetical protein